jgi:hypothetical protein
MVDLTKLTTATFESLSDFQLIVKSNILHQDCVVAQGAQRMIGPFVTLLGGSTKWYEKIAESE